MNLESILPPLPSPYTAARIAGEDWDLFTSVQMHAHALVAARAGALAALDEASMQVDDEAVHEDSADHENFNNGICAAREVIRRLRDTIMEGK